MTRERVPMGAGKRHGFTRSRRGALRAWLMGAVCALPMGSVHAVLPADANQGQASATLPVPAPKHWVWVNDFVFPHMSDGMAYLVDGDSGRYLGTLSTGFSFERIHLSRDGKLIYSPEVYFSRGVRGTRTDVVTLYDAGTLNPVGEIPIPAKRASNLPMMANSALTDDDRFLLVYNFTAQQSITVVDTASRRFVREIEAPGCALVYPTGPRAFFSVCGDGALLLIELDDAGAIVEQRRTQPVLDVHGDPATEKAVRSGRTWYFTSYDGRVYPLDVGARQGAAGASWWLTSEAERKAGWRPGGLQQLAIHVAQGRLFALMHRGGRDTHKDPGQEVWVYDVSTHQRVQQIELKTLATSIQVSTDDHPLMYAISIAGSDLDVYDPGSGKLLRTVEHIGTSPTLLITP